jgi:hypothetical protein
MNRIVVSFRFQWTVYPASIHATSEPQPDRHDEGDFFVARKSAELWLEQSVVDVLRL